MRKQGDQQAEDSNRRKPHQHHDHGHNDLIPVIQRHPDPLPGIATAADGNTHQNGKHNHLQHVAISHGLHWIGGKNIENYLLQGRAFAGHILGFSGQVDALARIHNRSCHQAQGNSDGRGEHIKTHGFGANTSHAGVVTQITCTTGQGHKHQRHYQQLQTDNKNFATQVEETVDDIHQQRMVIGQAHAKHNGSQQNAEHHANKDVSG